jgi:hypothetical protein
MEAPYEAERLKAVRALNLIGATPKPKFESITALMKQMFETPVAAVTLIDDDLHFVARAGDWACSAGRQGEQGAACWPPGLLACCGRVPGTGVRDEMLNCGCN